MGANYIFVRLQIYVGWKWSWSNSRWNGYSLVYTSLLTRQNYAKECDILCQSLVKNKKLVKRKKKHYDNIKNYILMLQFLHSTISKIIEGEKAIFLERNFFFDVNLMIGEPLKWLWCVCFVFIPYGDKQIDKKIMFK